MTECNAIIESNNEIDKLKRENNILKASNGEYEDALARLEEENEQLKQFKENVIKWVDSQMKFNAKKYRKVLGLIMDNNGDLLDLTEIEERLNEQDETIQHVIKTLQSFSKRDLVDIERIFLNNLCKELGIKLE